MQGAKDMCQCCPWRALLACLQCSPCEERGCANGAVDVSSLKSVFGLPDIVRHFKGDGERELYQATELFTVVPRHLVDEFLDAVLFDGVGIQLFVLKQVFQDGSSVWRVDCLPCRTP